MSRVVKKRQSKSIEERYQNLTDIEHVLKRPGTYIGSTNQTTEKRWYYSENECTMEKKLFTFTPGFLQIFDEILVNAIDHSVRDLTVKSIKVVINEITGEISVWNDGNGVPVVIHKDVNMYVPEMIFGNLRSGENYDDTTERIVGGMNGLGAKATNIFSTKFTVETVCSEHKKKYIQVFEDNMSKKSTPKITTCSTKPYTKISFIADFQKFGMTGLDNDTVTLLKSRVYDATACTRSDITVHLNGTQIPVKTFERYIDLYIGTRGETKREYIYIKDENTGRVWEIGVCCSENDTFEHISFVNGISTPKGGKHVDYITNKIVTKLAAYIKSRHKDLTIRNNYIKDYLWVFIKATVVNPEFSSQTKDELTTPASKFKFSCEISDASIKKIASIGIMDKVLSYAQFKEDKSLSATDGRKRSNIRGIPKLEDANWAGTKKSSECTLILTEGDSAKSLAVAGLSVVGRDAYGVFPLRGKMLNVKEATASQLLNNAEINALKKIIGLEQGRVYDNLDPLRYGSVMIFTDADVDGSHIKGLVMNFFHTFWPSLIKVNGFLRAMRTPMLKASRNRETINFYSESEYNTWRDSTLNVSQWKIKYYKGLGTSSDVEAKEYFSDLERNVVYYDWTNDKFCNAAIHLAFNKKYIPQRKTWLKKYDKDNILNTNSNNITFNDFVKKDLVHFSAADIIRSIPCVVDGLKPSQRKVLFAVLKYAKKYGNNTEIKVAQLAGYVAQHTEYHHGEASLMSTIVNMAQRFVGSNNINLLYPSGQFGTRLSGKDAASPRYIFTRLDEATLQLFQKEDSPLLNYLVEDGKQIEPLWYAPIIPIVLVNGCEGIGTGFSTNIPCYNPTDITNNLIRLLNGEEMVEMIPWYRGYTGNVIKSGKTFVSTGVYTFDESSAVMTITELPIGAWKQNYKEFLESIVIDTKETTGQFINGFEEYHPSTNTVKYVIRINRTMVDKVKKEGFEKVFKLTNSAWRKTISTNNMHLLDRNWTIKKYDTPLEIIQECFNIRMEMYVKRKEYIISQLKQELIILDSKTKFILGIINSTIVVSNRARANIEEQLITQKFPKIDDSYNYLTGMPIYSLTKERVEELKNKLTTAQTKLNDIQSTSEKQMWTSELLHFKGSVEKLMTFEDESGVIGKSKNCIPKKRVVRKNV